ncbi:MAG: hypothetical protein F7C32_00075 [Desulfurococcales archaeon]|nr:hypothetical protein [Desulfurococcales archaeon]
MPLDLLDRLLIIKTRPYTEKEIREILRVRADEEEVPITEEALEKLTQIGSKRSLRYAVQLMEPAKIVAFRKGRHKIEPDDVEEAAKLFADVSESIEMLEKYGDRFLK